MFWVLYKNLEKEVVELSHKLNFCDELDNCYSIYISDLLIRTAVLIEAISKELYKSAGGNMNPKDNNGIDRDLLFDSDCIQFLDVKWGITNKVVKVVCPSFYFSKIENLELRPLKNCNKRGKGRWKKAYQALKHDMVGSIKMGTVANLIRALAALYILNIYYRNEVYQSGTMFNSIAFDTRMGSDIFAATIVFADKYNFDYLKFKEATDEDFRSSVLIQKYTEDSFINLYKSINVFISETKIKIAKNFNINDFLCKNPNYKFRGYLSFARDVGGEEFVKELLRNHSIVNEMKKAELEIVLSKGQKIYSIDN